jgi:hypothetical protein
LNPPQTNKIGVRNHPYEPVVVVGNTEARDSKLMDALEDRIEALIRANRVDWSGHVQTDRHGELAQFNLLRA